MNKVDWLAILLASIGAWLLILPLIMEPTGLDVVSWNFGLTGFAVAMFAYGALLSYWRADEFVVLAGSWLVASPWLLEFSDSQAALLNAVGMGTLLVALALARIGARKRKT